MSDKTAELIRVLLFHKSRVEPQHAAVRGGRVDEVGQAKLCEQGQGAKKGVFITTSSHTAEATDCVSHIDTKVVLIDGQLLANLMMDFDVGVSVAATYMIKRIDSDYFEEGETGI